MDVFLPTIPDGDPPEIRAPDRRGDPKAYQIGETITQRRAIYVASKLFPDDMADGTDCRKETGREGEPCRVCAARNEQWAARVRQVRQAMISAFS